MILESGKNQPRIELNGTALTSGIAIGTSYSFKQIDLEPLTLNPFPVSDLSIEMERFEHSINKSREQLYSIYKSHFDEGKSEIADIFGAHLQLIEDRSFLQTIRDTMELDLLNAEHVLAIKIQDIENSFSEIENEILKTKLSDIKDVYFRLLRNLLDIEHIRVSPLIRRINHPILIAEQLLPSDIALLEFRKINGIIIEELSAVSHVAIITRSLGIPAIMNIPGISTLVRSGCPVILDTYNSKVIVNPYPEEFNIYRRKRRIYSKVNKQTRSHVRCLTKDGVRIHLDANANFPNEIEDAIRKGAEGIGLLRSEYFYLSHSSIPSIHEEIFFYQEVLKSATNRIVTIRLIDIGADKSLPYMPMDKEDNPQLGLRGVRFLLANHELLSSHLSSILLASRNTRVKILLPFVTTESEVDIIISIVNELASEYDLDLSSIKLGIMVEIPSILWSLQSIIQKIDFLSIGTNDLTQFLFAASREDSRMDHFRMRSLPVLLAIIKYIVNVAAPLQKEVVVCGEMASDPSIAPFLIGAGIRTLSVQLSAIGAVRKEIESRSLEQDIDLVEEFLRNSFPGGEGPLRMSA